MWGNRLALENSVLFVHFSIKGKFNISSKKMQTSCFKTINQKLLMLFECNVVVNLKRETNSKVILFSFKWSCLKALLYLHVLNIAMFIYDNIGSNNLTTYFHLWWRQRKTAYKWQKVVIQWTLEENEGVKICDLQLQVHNPALLPVVYVQFMLLVNGNSILYSIRVQNNLNANKSSRKTEL